MLSLIALSAGAIFLLNSCIPSVVVPEIPLTPKAEVFKNAPDCVEEIETFQNSEGENVYPLATEALLCLDEDSIYWQNQYILLRNQVEAVQTKPRR